MLRGLRRRLDRLWVAHQREKAMRERNRRGVREKFVAAIRAGLLDAGIDPASAPAMRPYEPGGCFAPRPEPPSRPPAESPTERLRARLLAIVERCREQPLDLAKATPFELFAMYCFIPDAPGVAYLIG